MNRVTFLGLVVCLLASGCATSKNPLSDPHASKPDNRLLGVWRCQNDSGDVTDYHVSHAGKIFPDSVMRVVAIRRVQGKEQPPEEFLVFPTVLGGKTYLNFVGGNGYLVYGDLPDKDRKPVKLIEEKGRQADLVERYIFLKYEVNGDKLVVWLIDKDGQERAIKSGKVKGKAADFTDTTENVARFVTEAGDSLFKMKEPGRLERVVERQHRSGLLFPKAVERARIGEGNAQSAPSDNPSGNIGPLPRNRPPSP